MVEKICRCCGKLFIAETNRKRLCDSCRKLNREKHAKEYCVKYRKEKRQSVLISKDDNKLLEKISSVCGMSKTKIIHAMIVEIYGENNF